MNIDLNDLEQEKVQIQIREDGKVVWINNPYGCIVRICGIEELQILDLRHATALTSEEKIKWIDNEPHN